MPNKRRKKDGQRMITINCWVTEADYVALAAKAHREGYSKGPRSGMHKMMSAHAHQIADWERELFGQAIQDRLNELAREQSASMDRIKEKLANTPIFAVDPKDLVPQSVTFDA